MGYFIEPSVVPHVTVLRHSGGVGRVLGVAFFVLGAAVSALGAMVSAASLPPTLFFGFGLLFASVGLLAVIAPRAPARLVFDNQQRRLFVHEDPSAAADLAASMPYEAIAGFDVREHVSQRNRRTQRTWDVVMVKHDCAWWKLDSFSRSDAAHALRDALSSNVHLAKPAASASASAPRGFALPPPFTEELSPDVSKLRWPRRLEPRSLIGILGVTGGFALLFSVAWSRLSGVAIGIASVMFALFVLVLLAAVAQTLGKQAEVTVTPEQLEFREMSGFLPRSFRMPLASITAATFMFSDAGGDAAVLVLDEGAEATFRAAATTTPKELSEVFALAVTMTRVKRITVLELNITARLALEQWIEREIARHGGHAR